jgi:hypothetical protein
VSPMVEVLTRFINEDKMKTANIEGQSKIVDAIGSADLAAFSKVLSLNFLEEPRDGTVGYSVILVLAADRPNTNFSLRIRFSNVKELTVRGFGASPTQITGFNILDVLDRQMEGV